MENVEENGDGEMEKGRRKMRKVGKNDNGKEENEI